jgi:hypothetical protein
MEAPVLGTSKYFWSFAFGTVQYSYPSVEVIYVILYQRNLYDTSSDLEDMFFMTDFRSVVIYAR